MNPKLSMNALILALSAGAFLCFGAWQLYGAWIDGRREKLRKRGLHPVTTGRGDVEARESEDGGTDHGE